MDLLRGSTAGQVLQVMLSVRSVFLGSQPSAHIWGESLSAGERRGLHVGCDHSKLVTAC